MPAISDAVQLDNAPRLLHLKHENWLCFVKLESVGSGSELERLQRRRAEESVPAPAALDVEVNVNQHGGDGPAS